MEAVMVTTSYVNKNYNDDTEVIVVKDMKATQDYVQKDYAEEKARVLEAKYATRTQWCDGESAELSYVSNAGVEVCMKWKIANQTSNVTT